MGGRYYRNIKGRGEDAPYKVYFTYLNYKPYPAHDLHHKMDKAAAEGLSAGYEDVRRYAQ